MVAGEGACALEMIKHPPDHARVLNAGDDLHGTSAMDALFDIDTKHALETAGPGHGAAFFWFCSSSGACDALTAPCWRDQGAQRAVRCEDSVVTRKVDARPWNQSRESGNKVQRLQQHMGGAIAPGRLERVAYESLAGQRQARAGQGRAGDVAAQALDLVSIIGPGGDAGGFRCWSKWVSG